MAKKRATHNGSSKDDKGFYTTSVQRGGSGQYESISVPKRVGGAGGRNVTSAAGLRIQAEARYAETGGRYNLPRSGRTAHEEPVIMNTQRLFVNGQEMMGAAGKRVAKFKSRGGAGGVKKR